MSNTGTYREFRVGRIRLIIFIAVAILHVTLILTIAVHMETVMAKPEPAAGIMKLVDIEEAPPPPPPEIISEPILTNTQESIAETMIETDTLPPPVVSSYSPPASTVTGDQIDYLPQHRITLVPVLPESEIIRATVYPPIAQRSNIEGVVYLELFIDRQGNVRQVRVLRENPPGRGFGEAAVNAFRGIRGKPAEANGEPVAVRYRYNFTFKLN